MNKSTDPTLIFVYNTRGDTISELKYIAKDITGTHDENSKCGLCALTHGTFSMRKDWQSFLQNVSVATEFLHRDEFADTYDMDIGFPAVLEKTDESLEVIVSADQISNAESLTDLKRVINAKI
ncbi:MAG: hypothetical protein BRC25_03495 [Parcubacteria group bacterium SW_6_46_9]|nr:MAG: hypothetical protein BRC25_03495 [Parcubacteria group bacterium SW_6_46_9]